MTYRVLSLDGGGAWALIQVKTLMALFGANASGHDVLASFDLAAANSGGSLTLAVLAENKRLSDMLDLFRNEANRRSIFSPTRSVWQPLYKLIGLGPKYSTVAKLPAIRKLLPVTGDQVLRTVAQAIPGASGKSVHLLIVGFDYDTKRAVFFRSAEVKDRPVWGGGAPASCTLAEAVHVSTNAPINYFDAPASIPSARDRFWDGGITGCNNPAVAATVEAITQGVAPAEIRLLSIGTGTVFLPFSDPPQPPFTADRAEPSFVADLQKLATDRLRWCNVDEPEPPMDTADPVPGHEPEAEAAQQPPQRLASAPVPLAAALHAEVRLVATLTAFRPLGADTPAPQRPP